MRSLIVALAKALNLINREMQHHHEQTAYLAFRIAFAMGLRGETLNLVLYAALLHDIGFEALDDTSTLQEIEKGRKRVARAGASMIREVEELRPIADIIEIVQNSYAVNRELLKGDVRLDISQAVHLSDYVTTIFREDRPILDQVKGILAAVEALRGSEFSPEAVDALLEIGRTESLWLDVALNPEVLVLYVGKLRRVRLEEVVVFTRFMSRIIDFRSPFTAMHSAGVAATARELARLAGMTAEEVKMMEIAGNLHDIGKLRVLITALDGRLAGGHGKTGVANFRRRRIVHLHQPAEDFPQRRFRFADGNIRGKRTQAELGLPAFRQVKAQLLKNLLPLLQKLRLSRAEIQQQMNQELMKDGQYLGLMAGANTVTIHDGTPEEFHKFFPIYSAKRVRPQIDHFRDIVQRAGMTARFSYAETDA